MPILDLIYKIAFWFVTFGGIAYLLYRWGKSGLLGILSPYFFIDLIKAIWKLVRLYPVFFTCIAIISLLTALYYIMKEA